MYMFMLIEFQLKQFLTSQVNTQRSWIYISENYTAYLKVSDDKMYHPDIRRLRRKNNIYFQVSKDMR